jgi:NRAMP (natural resistance-associated macrophage protein)-like metal ion transporter
MKFKLDFRKKLAGLMIIFAIIGPGIITANVDNDAGGITTYSMAGGHFGYALLWTMIPVLILLVIVQEMCARLGVITGKGLADLIRENFSIKITFIIMGLLVIVNVANTITEFAGVAAAGEIFGISRYILVPLAALFVWLLVLKGNYKSVEKVFLFACLFYISYIIAGFITHQSWKLIAIKTVVPTFIWNKEYLMLIIGIIGTTIAPWMQFYLQSSVVEKGVKKEEYKYSKIDVIVGCFMAVIVAFFITITTAATIFPQGIRIETAKDAALALAPIAGRFAEFLFAFGLLNAGLFAASILPLSTAYSVSEAFGWESGVNRKFKEAKQFYILYTATIILGAVFVLIPGFNLITLMYFSQVLNGILLPFIIIFMLKLINKTELMGEYKNGKVYNIISYVSAFIIIAITLVMIITMIFPKLF